MTNAPPEDMPTLLQLLNALIGFFAAFLLGVVLGYAAGISRPPDVED